MKVGHWKFSTLHQSACKIIEFMDLWDHEVAQVWFPANNLVTHVLSRDLIPLDAELDKQRSAAYIEYISAAAKVAEVLEGPQQPTDEQVLLAPMESNVIPLPHQIQALSKATAGHQVRFLLADEVGLGKTIEAGLIMRELKLKGLIRRTLVVAPKGIAAQWISEMQDHFNEDFKLIHGNEIATLDRLASVNISEREIGSAWSMYDQVVVSLDSVKPIQRRRGWSKEQLHEYNKTRYENLITAGWDLIIVDETHRLGGSTDQVARYKLGRGLSEAAPYLLLLSATPHQGKSDAFHRIMNLLDANAFPTQEDVTHAQVAPYVIRTEKRNAIDVSGKPLFKPRNTQVIPVKWDTRHQDQQRLYEAVTEYVRVGYNKALQEKKRYIGFLMILMQRLVVSSTSAIRTTLERRLSVLSEGATRNDIQIGIESNDFESADSLDEIFDMSGQDLLDSLLKNSSLAFRAEVEQVEALLAVAQRCEQNSPDAKAEALLERIYQLEVQENEDDLKILIFTEFIPTQKMLSTFLEARGISVCLLNGSMSMEERSKAQEAFRDQSRVMISTDAGGEGLNLQFCHVVINYDIPWNPMRLEQRIGRVDRIGQTKPVIALNFMFEESVEYRVREVLEEKLSVIYEEFGIDKTGDVLDSAQAGEIFEDVYANAIANPDAIDDTIDKTVTSVKAEIQRVKESSTIYGISDEPNSDLASRLREHPLPFWVERMTVGYIRSHGGETEREGNCWNLRWPSGRKQARCVFNRETHEQIGGSVLLNLERKSIRRLALQIPQLFDYNHVPIVQIDGLAPGLQGTWGLFEISIGVNNGSGSVVARLPQKRRSLISVFLSPAGDVFIPTARHIWDALLSNTPTILGVLDNQESRNRREELSTVAAESGQEVFASLREAHFAAINDESNRRNKAFQAKQKLIKRVGLPEVRQHRLIGLQREQNQWEIEIEQAHKIIPQLKLLLALAIGEGEFNG